MNRNTLQIAVLALVLTWAGNASVQAQEIGIRALRLLDKQSLALLNEEARRHYDDAIQAIDHVDMEGALESLEAASAAQPGHIDLAFLTADVARRRARLHYGEEAKKRLSIAINAYDRILSRSDIDQDVLTRDRALSMKKATQEDFNRIDFRDEKRREHGMRLNLAIAQIYNLPLEKTISPKEDDALSQDPTLPFNFMKVEGELPSAPSGPTMEVNPALQQTQAGFGGAQPGFGGAQPGFGGAQPGANPFGAAPGAANPGGANPFGAAPAAGGGNPFGAPPAGGNPFGAPAAGGNPFAGGGAAPAAGGGNPFAAPAAQNNNFAGMK